MDWRPEPRHGEDLGTFFYQSRFGGFHRFLPAADKGRCEVRITMRNFCFAIASFCFILSLLFGLVRNSCYRRAVSSAYAHSNIAPTATAAGNVFKSEPAPEPVRTTSINRTGDFR